MKAGYFVQYINEYLRFTDKGFISNYMSLPVKQSSIYGSNLAVKKIREDTKEIVLEPISIGTFQLIEIYEAITKKISNDIEILNQYSIVIEYIIRSDLITIPVLTCGVLEAGSIRAIESVESKKEVFFFSTENDLDMGEFLDANLPYITEDFLDDPEKVETIINPIFEKLWLMDLDPITLKKYLSMPEKLDKAYTRYFLNK